MISHRSLGPRCIQEPLSSSTLLPPPEWKASQQAGSLVALYCASGKSLNCHFSRGAAGLFFTARIEGPPFHRGASASKKNGPAAPLAETARFMISDVLILPASPPRAQNAPKQAGDWTVLHCAHQGPSSIQVISLSSLVFPLLEGHACWSMCGRRTRPFSGRAFREHIDQCGCPSNLFHLSSSTFFSTRAEGIPTSG